jgi:hypothetical protein
MCRRAEAERSTRARAGAGTSASIAKNDSATLMLYTGEPADAPPNSITFAPEGIRRVWFALR